MIDVAGLASHIIYKEQNPRFKTEDQRRKFLKDLAKELCMPLVEARSINQVVMRKQFIRGAVQMMIERRIVSPQEATATSTVHYGSHGSTPIVGSCYFCRNQNRKQRKIRKMSGKMQYCNISHWQYLPVRK